MKRIISSLTFNMQLSRIPANKVDISVLTEKIQFRNGKEAKNRIMKAPLSEKLYNWNQPDENLRGTLNEAIINLYNKWANGGFGMILTGNIGIDPKYIGEAGQGIISLENICKKEKANFAKLAKTMKSEGSLAVAQINHVGNQALTSYSTQDGQIFQIHKTKPDDPLTFSKDRLYNDIIVRFGHAAKVLFESGFDGMEIHTAHGMLFNQFLSSSNDRKDEYGGGNIDSRSRLLVDTYRHIRQLVKPETGFLIGAKLNSVDFQNSGLNKSDLKQFCNIIEETGFDFVELTGGSMETDSNEQQMRESTTRREDFFIDFVRLASQIFVKTKVYITGNWQTAKGMLNSINTGETDGFGFGRWSCQEPDFPKKLLAGQIFSKPHIKFGSTDYFTAKNASHHQIRQMSEQKGISSNVTDFTREEEADNFKKYVQEYQHHLKTLPGGFNSETGCIVYKPL